jgi:hypothetical protein
MFASANNPEGQDRPAAQGASPSPVGGGRDTGMSAPPWLDAPRARVSVAEVPRVRVEACVTAWQFGQKYAVR